MVGFVEAVDFLGRAPEQIRLLSLSTTSYRFRIGQKQQVRRPAGLEHQDHRDADVRPGATCDCPVRCLLRRGLFHRIDYLTEPRPYHMNNASCVQQLLTIGRSTAELNEHMSIVQKEFLNGEAIEQFQLK
jgi:hypothetical protein